MIASQIAGTTLPTADVRGDAKLKRAASEFETILLTSWLEKMRDAYGLDDKGESMPGSDSLTALGTQAVASAIAARGGIGVAKLMYEHLRGRAVGLEKPR